MEFLTEFHPATQPLQTFNWQRAPYWIIRLIQSANDDKKKFDLHFHVHVSGVWKIVYCKRCYSNLIVPLQVPDYMLLVQLMSTAGQSDDCDKLLKVMAVQTVNPYNWRTLHTHNIPNSFGKWVNCVRSTFSFDSVKEKIRWSGRVGSSSKINELNWAELC